MCVYIDICVYIEVIAYNIFNCEPMALGCPWPVPPWDEGVDHWREKQAVHWDKVGT